MENDKMSLADKILLDNQRLLHYANENFPKTGEEVTVVTQTAGHQIIIEKGEVDADSSS